MKSLATTRTEIADNTTRTQISDISELGPELDEGQLLMVAGGQRPDGGTVTTACPSGCHD